MSQVNGHVTEETKKRCQSLAWRMRKIDECTQASCLAQPSIDPYLLDAALQDTTCSAVACVLVLYTGGTIGMRPVEGAYQPVPNFLVRSLAKMPTFNDPHFERPRQRGNIGRKPSQSFTQLDTHAASCMSLETSHSNATFVLPLTKSRRRIFYSIAEYTPLLDSSDMTMDDWVRIARDIKAYYDLFDGFVILHGTDTLAYTASALSFMLENLGKPVVLTGSQVPIFEVRSDGWNNFLGALLIAGGGYPLCEVTVFFHDKLFRGSRVVKCSSNEFHAFASPNYPPLAKCDVDITFFPDLAFHPIGPQHVFTIHTELCRDVAVLNMFPSIAAEHVATFLAPPTKENRTLFGVVIRTYGAGNIPAGRKDLLAAFKAASDRGILMINVTQCYRGGVKAIYSTGMILNNYGVIPGYDMTTEAALTKLAYVLGRHDLPDVTSKRAHLLRSLRGEVTIEGEDAQSARLHGPHHLNRIGSEKSLMTYLAELFSDAKSDDLDGRGSMWARRLAPAVACTAAASNNVASLEELYNMIGHLQLADSEGSTTLHKAVLHGNYEATQFLLEHGASVHSKDLWGWTPLDCAIRSARATPNLIQLLLNAGARLSVADLKISRAISLAAAAGDTTRLRLYRLAGCALEDVDSEGRNALHVAVANRQLETIEYLISPAHHSNSQPDGEKEPDEMFFRFMGGAGVDPRITTSWGTTAFDEARLRKFEDVLKLLEQSPLLNGSEATVES